MSRLTLYNDSSSDATVISNQFIDEYMKDANDAQIKVYLYLLRMIQDGRATSISDIADQFNHTEKDVIRAIKYWERMKLLELDYDEQGNMKGIHLQDLDRLPSAEIVDLSAHKTNSMTKVDKPETEDIVVVAADEKKTYSRDELKQLKADEEFSQILFVAQAINTRPLSQSAVQTLAFIYDELHFSFELMDYLIEYCADRGKTNHNYMETIARNWANSGITTVEEAKKESTLYEKDVYTILKALGDQNAPTKNIATTIKDWTTHFNMEVILEACDRTVHATTKNRIGYTKKILDSWKASGVHTLADIAPLDEAHAKKSAQARDNKSKSTNNNTFNQFEQRSYDYDSLMKSLRSN